MKESREAELRRLRERSFAEPRSAQRFVTPPQRVPSPPMPPPEGETLAAVASITAAKRNTEEAWKAAIVQAHGAGETLRSIASVAGVSNPTVLSIVRAAKSQGC